MDPLTAAVIAVIIIIILLIFYLPKNDDKELFRSAQNKINRSYAYSDYQNNLLSRCLSNKNNKNAILTPDTSAKLISIRELNRTIRQQIADLDAAMLTIQSMPDGKERVAVLHSALDTLWFLQCDQDKRISELISFTPIPIKTW